MQSMSLPRSCPPASECEACWPCPQHLHYSMLHGEAASPTSPCWPASIWPTHDTQFWRNCNLNGSLSSGRRGPGRISCSSTSSSSSYEDICSDDVDDNNNNSIIGVEQLGGLNGTTTTTCSKDTTTTNNDIDGNANNNSGTEDVTNNNPSDSYTGTKRTKNSAPRPRVVDEEGFIRRAACVCVDETQSKVLLVSSKKKDCISWLVPGGGVEAGEEISEAAMREAWEEAGVQGSIDRYLGLFETQHHSGRKRHRTAVFVVRVKEIQAQYPEAHLGRQREWFSLEEALLLLSRYRPLQSAYLQLMLVSQLKVPPA